MTSKTTRFDAADYLDTEERQVAFIATALETGDADFVRDALGLVARARGMGEIAKRCRLEPGELVQGVGQIGQSRVCHGDAHRSRFGAYFSLARPAITAKTQIEGAPRGVILRLSLLRIRLSPIERLHA